MFDLDRSGSIEIEEMSAIAIKRRELGHKKDIWTDEKNRKLVNRLDANCNGLISAREFIKYYSRLHSACNAPAFIDVIGQYMEVARSLYIDRMNALRNMQAEIFNPKN